MGVFSKVSDNFKKIFEISQLSGVETENIEKLLKRIPLSNYLMPVAYDDKNGFYICDDNYIGFVFFIYSKPVLGRETLSFLENGIYQDSSIPPNTLIQWIYWGTDYINPLTDLYLSMKEKSYRGVAKDYVRFLKEHVNCGFTPEWQTPVRDAQIYFTVKFPCSSSEYERKKDMFKSIKQGIKSTLLQGGFYPREIDVENLVFLYRLLFNPNHPRDEEVLYDESKEIREQAVCRNTLIEQSSRHDLIRIDGAWGKVLTVKTYPREIVCTDVMEYIGSTQHLNRNQINTPFIFSLLLRKATEKEISNIKQKAEITIKQKGFSMLSRRLADRQEDFVFLSRELEEGQVMWKGCLTWYLYHNNIEYLKTAIRTLKNMLVERGIELQEELINLPFFLSSTPLNFIEDITTTKLRRFNTMLSCNATHLTPVQSDWKGSGTPIVPFVSRRNQVVFVDLWDTQGGMNASIVGPMGVGKSMLTNHIIFNYRSIPDTLIRVIDVGESYYGITKLFSGEYIKPGFDNPMVVNPFSEVVNPDQEMDFLVSIVDKMVKPQEFCDDAERGMLEMAIRNTLNRWGKTTTITKIKDEIYKIAKEREDQEFLKLAEFNLLPWCAGGQYSAFFNGPSQVNLTNRLIVFELGGIKDDQKLTNIFLMSLFFHINKEVYHGAKDVKNLVIWDEAWRFFANPQILRFIEQGAREYRKFGASLITISQNISDLQKNEVTKVLKNNSEYIFVFWQPPEEWERIQQDKEIFISDYEKNLLRDTLQTVKGSYSEVFIISRSRGRGIARLVIPEHIYWLYTTDAKEVAIRQKFIEEGGNLNLSEAIKKCIAWKKQQTQVKAKEKIEESSN
jgi:conjugal transfer ATP-binding protein TraC